MFYLLFFKTLSLLNKEKEMTTSFFFFTLFRQSPFSLIVSIELEFFDRKYCISVICKEGNKQ